MKPRAIVPVIKADRQVAQAPAGDITGSITRAPRIVPTSAEVDPEDVAPVKAKPVVKKKSAARPSAQRKHAAVARNNACGSYRAVWYTNKEGRRKYRCVKSG